MGAEPALSFFFFLLWIVSGQPNINLQTTLLRAPAHGQAGAPQASALPLDQSIAHFSPNPLSFHHSFADDHTRDTALSTAYRIYETSVDPNAVGVTYKLLGVSEVQPISGAQDPLKDLLPLLTTLRATYPLHIPTLLLLGAVYHMTGDYTASIQVHEEILTIDDQCVSMLLLW